MCLIARHVESLGLPTLILGSCLDILQSGRPPRAQFVNYPLGFESGKFRDKQNQLEMVRQALCGLDTMTAPGIEQLPFEWQAGWELVNEREKGKFDLRSPRAATPQYQTEEDRRLARQDQRASSGSSGPLTEHLH